MNITLLIVGCGGTGSWMVNPALQIIAQHSLSNPETSNRAILIDKDEVEEKNTLRQAFTLNNVGTNKALALAERYVPNYEAIPNMEVSIIQKFVLDDPERTEHLDRFIDFDLAEEFCVADSLCIVVNVIDNNKTRKAVHASFQNSSNPHYILDGGNEDTYGQVTVTTYCDALTGPLKTFWDLHPDMLQYNDGVKAGPSCAEHDEEAANAGVEQTMSANTISASILTDYVRKIVSNIEGLFDGSFILRNETGFIIGGDGLSYRYID